MGIGIFDRLGFPASMANNTIDFSKDTQNSLNNMPQILTTWQMEDIANNTTTGYFQNPVSANVNLLISLVSNIYVTANNKGYTEIADAANNIIYNNTLVYFNEHTDRLSGVEPVSANTVHLPHFQTCIGLGKALTYLVYQSDGISNNAVMMGSFGSLYTNDDLVTYYNTLSSDNALINGAGILTPTQNTVIAANVASLNTYITNAITQDINYFANCNTLIADYNSVKGFGHMGDTEKDLVNNLVGTEKLKSRIS